jgi:hypothetical protein
MSQATSLKSNMIDLDVISHNVQWSKNIFGADVRGRYIYII